MSQVVIPPASLERLRLAYGQFEQLAQVVAEALGIPPGAARHLDLVGGCFELQDASKAEQKNGVAV